MSLFFFDKSILLYIFLLVTLIHFAGALGMKEEDPYGSSMAYMTKTPEATVLVDIGIFQFFLFIGCLFSPFCFC